MRKELEIPCAALLPPAPGITSSARRMQKEPRWSTVLWIFREMLLCTSLSAAPGLLRRSREDAALSRRAPAALQPGPAGDSSRPGVRGSHPSGSHR